MLKRLIILERGEEFHCDSKEDVVKKLIANNFYDLSENEKKDKMEMLAIANCLGARKDIIKDVKEDNFNIDDKFIIKDEMTYVLSLLLTNKVILLERTDANIFLKDINKTGIDKNYMIVNKFAQEILRDYLKKE